MEKRSHIAISLKKTLRGGEGKIYRIGELRKLGVHAESVMESKRGEGSVGYPYSSKR